MVMMGAILKMLNEKFTYLLVYSLIFLHSQEEILVYTEILQNLYYPAAL